MYVHGHLTVNGEKMSKSRGNGIDPLRYLDLGMNPEWMRYYLATKLNSRVEDADFNSIDFANRVNADLVGKYVNIGSRAAGFIRKKFDGKLAALDPEGGALIGNLQDLVRTSAELYERREFSRCIREIMVMADRVNEFIDKHKPWELAKEQSKDSQLQQVCSACIEAFRLLTICLKPVIPCVARQVEEFLNIGSLEFTHSLLLLGAGHRISEYRHLIRRVEPGAIDAAFNVA